MLLAVGCSDDDDGGGEQQAAGTTTSAAAVECVETEPTDVVATRGELSFAVVDTGASVDVIAVFVEAECGLARVDLDGAPTALPVGGSVTHAEGLACDDDGGLAVLSATSDDGVSFEATKVTYQVEGGELVEVDRETSTIDATVDPGALDPYYRLDC